MDARLKTLGAFLVGAAAVATAVIAWQALNRTPRGELRASVAPHDYQTAPSFDPSRNATDSATVRPLASYFVVHVQNSGNDQITSVTLTFPSATEWCSRRPPQPWKCATQGEEYVIGDLMPHKTADVHVWASRTYTSTDLASISITHAHGLGAVQFERDRAIPWLYLVASAVFSLMLGVVLATFVRKRDMKDLADQTKNLETEIQRVSVAASSAQQHTAAMLEILLKHVDDPALKDFLLQRRAKILDGSISLSDVVLGIEQRKN